MRFRRRTATSADAREIVDVVNEAFLIEAEILSGERITLEEVLDRLDHGAFLVFETKAGEIAGCVYGEVRVGALGYLGLVAVLPDRQGLGLGGRLLTTGETWLREAGCQVCEIWVLSTRTDLLAWYERIGYRIVRTEPFEAVEPPPTRRQLQPCHFVIMHADLEHRR